MADQHKTRKLTQSEIEAFVKMYVIEHQMTTASASDDLLHLLMRLHEDGYSAGAAREREEHAATTRAETALHEISRAHTSFSLGHIDAKQALREINKALATWAVAKGDAARKN